MSVKNSINQGQQVSSEAPNHEVAAIKHVLITGGAGGIGRAASAYFLQKGWKVYSCDIGTQDSPGENIIPVAMDVRSTASIAAARDVVNAHTDHLDAVINLAGIYIMDSLLEIPEQDFLRIFDINFNGAYRVNRQFLPLVKNGGRIIIITSELSCLDPLPFNGIYSITKTALESYAHSLRLELALLDVPVITIRPGAVDTNMLKDSFSSMETMCKNTQLYKANALKFHNIMKRATGRPMTTAKLAGIIYRVAVVPYPRASYTVGAGLGLRLFSMLSAKTQAMLLKKLLK